MANPLRVYLSSTFADLEAYRDAVTRTVRYFGFQLVSLDEFGTFDTSILEAAREAIASSDIFVLILAHRYGSIPPNETKSILELEYEQAVSLKKPIFIYTVHDDVAWPVDKIDLDEQPRRALQAFKQRLYERFVVCSFSSPEDLASRLAVDISRYSKRVEGLPVEPPIPEEQPARIPTISDVMEVLKALQVEVSVLRRVIAEVPQRSRAMDSNNLESKPRPAEFLGVGRVAVNRAKCFVIMPYSERWSADVERIILEVCNEVGIEFSIAKNMEGRFIPHDIWNGITGAGVIVADLSGANPNVTYEVGLADVLGCEVIMLSQGTKVPFDFLGQRLIQYEDSLTGARLLREELASRLRRYKDAVINRVSEASGS